MKSRSLEIILIVIAAALLVWGVQRAFDRGDTAAKSWTTYAMSGLVILAGLNIAVRSQKLALAVLVVSSFFLVLVLAAALMSLADAAPHPILAVIRSIIFFALVGLAAWLQLQSIQPVADNGQPDIPANNDEPDAN